MLLGHSFIWNCGFLITIDSRKIIISLKTMSNCSVNCNYSIPFLSASLLVLFRKRILLDCHFWNGVVFLFQVIHIELTWINLRILIVELAAWPWIAVHNTYHLSMSVQDDSQKCLSVHEECVHSTWYALIGCLKVGSPEIMHNDTMIMCKKSDLIHCILSSFCRKVIICQLWCSDNMYSM